MEVKIINRSKNENPTYATEGASGFDLRANLYKQIFRILSLLQLTYVAFYQ